MSELIVTPYYDRHARREKIKQIIIDEGGDGSEWAINAIEKLLQGSDLELKVNHEVMKKYLDSCRSSRQTIAKRILVSEYVLGTWCEEDNQIELWRLKILGTFSKKYNWLVFFLNDVEKMS